jgi:hypothetical protein
MTCFFNMNRLRMFDCAAVFNALTEKIIANAQEIARKNGLETEYVRVFAARMLKRGRNRLSAVSGKLPADGLPDAAGDDA